MNSKTAEYPAERLVFPIAMTAAAHTIAVIRVRMHPSYRELAFPFALSFKSLHPLGISEF